MQIFNRWGQSIFVTWFFQGLERMHFIAFATLIARVLFAILVYLFIRNKDDDFLFLFFFGVGNIIAGLISIVTAFRIYKLKFIKPAWPGIIHEFKEGCFNYLKQPSFINPNLVPMKKLSSKIQNYFILLFLTILD